MVQKCTYHSDTVDGDAHMAVVKEENTRKNKMVKLIVENTPTAVDIKEDGSGTLYPELKEGRNVEWAFDINRKLILNLVGFTQKEKKDIGDIATVLDKNGILVK